MHILLRNLYVCILPKPHKSTEDFNISEMTFAAMVLFLLHVFLFFVSAETFLEKHKRNFFLFFSLLPLKGRWSESYIYLLSCKAPSFAENRHNEGRSYLCSCSRSSSFRTSLIFAMVFSFASCKSCYI
jgi:hypothetical protein